MRSPGINGEGELRGQLANPGSPGKMAIKTVCVCVRACPSLCSQEVHDVKRPITDFNLKNKNFYTVLEMLTLSHSNVHFPCEPGLGFFFVLIGFQVVRSVYAEM